MKTADRINESLAQINESSSQFKTEKDVLDYYSDKLKSASALVKKLDDEVWQLGEDSRNVPVQKNGFYSAKNQALVSSILKARTPKIASRDAAHSEYDRLEKAQNMALFEVRKAAGSLATVDNPNPASA